MENMKFKTLIILVFLPLTVFAEDAIILKQILTVRADMNQKILVKQLEAIPDNSQIQWKSGNYTFDTLTFKNKHNLEFVFEKNVTIHSNNIRFEDSHNVRLSQFNHINTNSTASINLGGSSNIYMSEINLESTDGKSGGLYIKKSQNIYLYKMMFKAMNKTNHINIEDSVVEVSHCSFSSTNDEYSRVDGKNSHIKIQNSAFKTEEADGISMDNSYGIIANNNFNSPLNDKTKSLYRAIYIYNESKFTINDNLINNYITGIRINTSSQSRIKGNTIKKAKIGIAVFNQSKADISDNTLININNPNYIEEKSFYSGIFINDSWVNIVDNKISNTFRGISAFNSDTIVSENTIKDIFNTNHYSGFGVYLYGEDTARSTSRLGDNNFINVTVGYNYHGNEHASIVTTRNYNYDYFKGRIYNTADPFILNLNIQHQSVQYDVMNKLAESKLSGAANFINAGWLSGILTKDQVVESTIIDAGTYLKIDTLSGNAIQFPSDYRGLKFKTLPKLNNRDTAIRITSSINDSQLTLRAETHNTIQSIKYNDQFDLPFIPSSHLKTGLDDYLISLKISNNPKQRSLSFITQDGQEIIHKFIFDNNTFHQLIDNTQVAKF